MIRRGHSGRGRVNEEVKEVNMADALFTQV
jgi:hypothetical protein